MAQEMGVVARTGKLIKRYVRTAWRRYQRLDIRAKLALWGLFIFYNALGAFLITVGADKIAQTLYDLAQDISSKPYGWAILLAALVIVSFPPFIGHTTIVTLCGFAYGMEGFFIAAAGTLFGSSIVFIALRWLFSKRLRAWTAGNEKWQALEAVVKAKGLPLIFLIRMSPFPPWVYANSLFASIEAVALWQFFFATFSVFPKVALHVFIGSRLASLSDGETRRHMDKQTKILNGCLVGGGILVGIITSLLIYRAMKNHIQHLEGISPEVDELAAEAVDEAAEGAPLLGSYSSESLDDDESTIRPTLSRSPTADV